MCMHRLTRLNLRELNELALKREAAPAQSYVAAQARTLEMRSYATV